MLIFDGLRIAQRVKVQRARLLGQGAGHGGRQPELAGQAALGIGKSAKNINRRRRGAVSVNHIGGAEFEVGPLDQERDLAERAQKWGKLGGVQMGGFAA